MSSVFGEILSGHAIREAIDEHLKLWLPSYLAEIERQQNRDVGTLPAFRSVSHQARIESFPEEQLPRLVIIIPGNSEDFTIDGEGLYQGTYQVALGAVTSASDQQGANKLAELYVVACAAAMVQHPKLGDLSTSVKLKRFANDEGPVEQSRSLALSVAYFEIQVGDVLDASQGPTEPSLEAAEWPEVETVEVEVQRT